MNYWLINTDARTLMSWDANGWTRLAIGDAPIQGDQVIVYVQDKNQFAGVGKVLGATDQPGVLRVEPLVLLEFDWIEASELHGSWPPFASGALPAGITSVAQADYDTIYQLVLPRAQAAGLA